MFFLKNLAYSTIKVYFKFIMNVEITMLKLNQPGFCEEFCQILGFCED